MIPEPPSSNFTVDVPQRAGHCYLGSFLSFQPSLFQSEESFHGRRLSLPSVYSVADFRQSAFLSFVANAIPVRPLRSTRVTRLPRYYEPVRLPTSPPGGYVFPPAVEGITLAMPGLPGSSANLSARAVPSHPDEPDGFFGSLLLRRWQASPSLEGWPTRICVTRPKRVRFRYGSHVRSAGLRRAGYPTRRPPRYLLNEQFTE